MTAPGDGLAVYGGIDTAKAAPGALLQASRRSTVFPLGLPAPLSSVASSEAHAQYEPVTPFYVQTVTG